MSRKPKKGYFVKGQFVAEGSELDLELRAEQTGGEPSRTELKKESTELQKLGEALLTLRATCSSGWICPNRCKPRWTNSSASPISRRRRQSQYVGKLMRQLEPETLQASATRWRNSAAAPPQRRWRCTRRRSGATT